MSGRGRKQLGNQIWPDGGEHRGGGGGGVMVAVYPCLQAPGAVSLRAALPLAPPFIAVHTCRSVSAATHATPL